MRFKQNNYFWMKEILSFIKFSLKKTKNDKDKWQFMLSLITQSNFKQKRHWLKLFYSNFPHSKIDIQLIYIYFDDLENQKSLPNAPIDTIKLAAQIRNLLNVEGVTIRVFSREVVDVGETVLYKILKHPLPWHRSSPGRQEQFQRMHEWLQTKKNIQRLRDLSSVSFARGFGLKKRSRSHVMSAVGQRKKKNEWLHTKRIAERARTLLERHEISRASLTSSLGISSINELLSRPTTWCMCGEQQKYAYRKLRDWVDSFKTVHQNWIS